MGQALVQQSFLYFCSTPPNGKWKVVLIIPLAVSFVVLLANPRNRLLALGTAASLTALAGLVSDIWLNLSATLPGGGIVQGGVERGIDISPWKRNP